MIMIVMMVVMLIVMVIMMKIIMGSRVISCGRLSLIAYLIFVTNPTNMFV